MSSSQHSQERVAVVGVGQTKYAAVRGDVSLPGLLREAVYRALADAHMTMDDIDADVKKWMTKAYDLAQPKEVAVKK